MCSLAEQISALSDPRPKSIDPEDFVQEDSAALLCDFPDEEGVLGKLKDGRSSLRARLRNTQLEDDPRYGGQSVSRRQLAKEWGGEGSCVTVHSVKESTLTSMFTKVSYLSPTRGSVVGGLRLSPT